MKKERFILGLTGIVLGHVLTIAVCLAAPPEENKSPLNIPQSLTEETLQTQESTVSEETESNLFKPVLLTVTLNKTQPYPIDLTTITRLIGRQNLALAYDRVGAGIQRARFYASLAAFLPDIRGTFDYNYFNGGAQIFGDEVFEFERTQVQPLLEASTTVYPGGRTIFTALAARQRQLSARAQTEETFQTQLARAAEEYYSLVEAYARQQVAIQSVLIAKEQVEVNTARRAAGVGTKLEQMQSVATQAREEDNLIQTESTYYQAEQNLINRLNLERHTELRPVLTTPSRVTLVPPEVTVDQLMIAALKNHPALAQTRAELKALGWERWATGSDIIPSVFLNTYIAGVGPEIDNLVRTRYAGLQIRMNVLEKMGLAIPLRLLEQSKIIDQRRIEQAQTLKNIESNIIKAYLDIQTADKSIDVAATAQEASEESYRLSNGRYQAGVGIYLDVLEAQRAVRNSRTQLIQAIISYNRAQIRLLEAAGLLTPESLLNGLDTSILPSGLKPRQP